MTADRWWVRLYARWMARVASVTSQLGLVFQAVAAVGIGAGALKYYGLQAWTPLFLTGLAAFVAAYTYAYSEGGAWNQMARDRQDLSNNFSDPDKLINFRIQARQAALIAHELQTNGDRDYDAILEDMQEETVEEWERLREGIDVER